MGGLDMITRSLVAPAWPGFGAPCEGDAGP